MRHLPALTTPLLLIGIVAIVIYGQSESRNLARVRAASDRFWSPYVRGIEAEQFGSLEAMTASADAVVRGAVVSVSEGRNYVADPYLGEQGYARFVAATVRVDEVLQRAGSYPVPATLTLEVFAPNRTSVKALLAQIPGEEALFVLRNKGTAALSAGVPPETANAESRYWALVTSDALIRDLGGTASVLPHTESPYIEAFDGRPFSDVLGAFARVASE